MPTYAYACTECGHRFDAVQSFSDDSLTTCPECQGRLRKSSTPSGSCSRDPVSTTRTPGRSPPATEPPAGRAPRPPPPPPVDQATAARRAPPRRHRPRRAPRPPQRRRTDRGRSTPCGPPLLGRGTGSYGAVMATTASPPAWLTGLPPPARRLPAGRPARRRRVPWRWVRLVAAALCLGVAGWLAVRLLAPPPPPHTVLVAVRDLPAGHTLLADDLTAVRVGDPLRPVDAVTDPQAVLGRSLAHPLSAAQVLTGSMLSVVSAFGAEERAVHVPITDPGALRALHPATGSTSSTAAAASSSPPACESSPSTTPRPIAPDTASSWPSPQGPLPPSSRR